MRYSAKPGEWKEDKKRIKPASADIILDSLNQLFLLGLEEPKVA